MMRISGIFLALLLLAGCTTFETNQKLAPHVDLSRYTGRWYIIANIPYFAERGNVGSYFEVSFPNGRVHDVYYGRSGGFDAKLSHFVMTGYVVEGKGGAYWRESPFWPLYLSYLILYVSPDYQTALVGYPGREYGWVLSRHPRMDDTTYQALLSRFAAQGYDTTMFRRIPQFPDQVGKPGFIEPGKLRPPIPSGCVRCSLPKQAGAPPRRRLPAGTAGGTTGQAASRACGSATNTATGETTSGSAHGGVPPPPFAHQPQPLEPVLRLRWVPRN